MGSGWHVTKLNEIKIHEKTSESHLFAISVTRVINLC